MGYVMFLLMLPEPADMGGGNRTMFTIAEIIHRKGHDIQLILGEEVDPKKIQDMWGLDVSKLNIASPLKTSKSPSIRYYRWLRLCKEIERKEGNGWSIWSDDVQRIGKRQTGRKDLVYAHYPLEIKLRNREYITPRKGVLQKFVFPFQKRMMLNVIGKGNFLAERVICNSLMCKNACEMAWERGEYDIIHPPVEINHITLSKIRNDETTRVLTLGSLTPDKGLEQLLEGIRKSPSSIHWQLIGICRDEKWLKKFHEKIEIYGLDDRITIWKDAPLSDVKKALSKSDVLLHGHAAEPFGIAVVEGLAAGLLPIVRRNGGPWYDIGDEGKWVKGFDTSDEIADLLKNVSRYDGKEWRKFRKTGKTRATDFSVEHFKSKISHLVDEISGGVSEHE